MRTSTESVRFERPFTAPPFAVVCHIARNEGTVGGHPLHYHPDTIEICLVVRGRLDWCVEDEAHVIRAGDVVLVPPGLRHGAVDASLQPCEFVALHLVPEELPARFATGVGGLRLRRTRLPEIASLVMRAFEEHRRADGPVPEVASALGVLLAFGFMDLAADVEKRRASDLVQTAQRVLEGKEGVRPKVEEVASRLGVSSAWLNRVFLNEVGLSPGDWARAQRLHRAKALVVRERATVTEVALRLGYTSGQSFATSFRQEFGLSPTEYRQASAGAWREDRQAPLRVAMR